MKKEVILEALKNAGVELEEDKLKEFMNAIHAENGKDLQKYKDDYASLEASKKELEEQLNSRLAEKDAELSKFNVDEINELRKYKEDNELRIKQEKEDGSIKDFLSANKYSSDEILLNYIKSTIRPEFDADSKITNGEQFLAALSEKAGQYKITEEVGGAKPQLPSSKPEPTDAFEAGFDSVFNKQ